MLISTILIVLIINETSGFFFRSSSGEPGRSCCKPPNVIVDSKRSNRGQDLVKRLVMDPNSVPSLTPDHICDFVHFLFQQMPIDKKSKESIDRKNNWRFFSMHIENIFRNVYSL